MTVGERVAERLKAANMSQAELARRVGIDQSTINALIKGSARTSRYLVQIARVLRTTPEYLACESDDADSAMVDTGLSVEEQDLLDYFRGLEPENKKAVLVIARSLATSARSDKVHSAQRILKGQ